MTRKERVFPIPNIFNYSPNAKSKLLRPEEQESIRKNNSASTPLNATSHFDSKNQQYTERLTRAATAGDLITEDYRNEAVSTALKDPLSPRISQLNIVIRSLVKVKSKKGKLVRWALVGVQRPKTVKSQQGTRLPAHRNAHI